MRVTNQMLMDNALTALARSLEKMERTQEQLTTGRRIIRSSDDPVGTSKAMGYRADLARLSQFQSNLGRGSSWLAQTDAALSSIGDLLTRATSIALSQASATATTETRTAAAAEVQGLLDEAMLLANTRFGDRYIFSGERTRTAPFVEATDGFLYVGDADAITEEIASGQYVQVNMDGLSAFCSPASAIEGTGISGSPMTSETTLADLGITPGSIRIANGGQTTTIVLTAATTIGDVIDAINDSGARVTAEFNTGCTGLVITNLLAGANLAISDVVPGTMATDLGIADSCGPSGALGALVDLKAALEADSTLSIQSAGQNVEQTSSELLNNRATVGAKMSRFEMATDRLDSQLVSLTEMLSDNEDADLARLATEYSLQQTAYQTALAVAGRLAQSTLLDFLR